MFQLFFMRETKINAKIFLLFFGEKNRINDEMSKAKSKDIGHKNVSST